MTAGTCLKLAVLFGFLAVLLGAFGAHGLSDSRYLVTKYGDMDPKIVSGMQLPASYKYLEDYRTGVRYQMWHALALMGIALLMQRQASRLLSAAAWCFVAGIALFSGSLYILVICGPKSGGVTWGLVAAVGGTCQLCGWLVLGMAVWRSDQNKISSDAAA